MHKARQMGEQQQSLTCYKQVKPLVVQITYGLAAPRLYTQWGMFHQAKKAKLGYQHAGGVSLT